MLTKVKKAFIEEFSENSFYLTQYRQRKEEKGKKFPNDFVSLTENHHKPSNSFNHIHSKLCGKLFEYHACWTLSKFIYIIYVETTLPSLSWATIRQSFRNVTIMLRVLLHKFASSHLLNLILISRKEKHMRMQQITVEVEFKLSTRFLLKFVLDD